MLDGLREPDFLLQMFAQTLGKGDQFDGLFPNGAPGSFHCVDNVVEVGPHSGRFDLSYGLFYDGEDSIVFWQDRLADFIEQVVKGGACNLIAASGAASFKLAQAAHLLGRDARQLLRIGGYQISASAVKSVQAASSSQS